MVSHDSEAITDVGNCNDPGCYSKIIKYNATIKQLAALVDVSISCRQSIRVINSIIITDYFIYNKLLMI